MSRCIFLILLSATFGLFLAACSNPNQRLQQSVNDLKVYVKTHEDSIDYYTDRSWSVIDKDFEGRKTSIDKDANKMNDEVQESYHAALRDWEAFKADYADRIADKIRLANMDKLRSSLTMDSIKTDFSNISENNVLQEYEHFVNTVKEVKDYYTQDQWRVIMLSWENLNDKCQELSKDIRQSDEKAIEKLRAEFDKMKAVNKASLAEDTVIKSD